LQAAAQESSDPVAQALSQVNKARKRESNPKLASAAGEGSSASAATPRTSTAPSTSDSSPSGGRTSKESATADSNSAPDFLGYRSKFRFGEHIQEPGTGDDVSVPARADSREYGNLTQSQRSSRGGGQCGSSPAAPGAFEFAKYGCAQNGFYASRRGAWDGQRLDIPSLCVNAVPSRLDSVNLDTFQQVVEKMSAAASLNLTGPPVEFRVKKHPFVRTDFDRGVGAVHM